MMYHTSQSGFTLVETLVAITILLLVIVGPMTISTTTARSTSFSSEQVIATFLAQEGLEVAQKARDDEILKDFHIESARETNWDDFVATGGAYQDCFETDGCGLEYSTDIDGTVVVHDCGSGCRLYYNESNERNRYTYDATGAEESPYTRIIKLQPDAGGHEVKVISTVMWRTGTLRESQSVSVETFLLDIYDTL